MATIVNDRDVALQAASSRFINPKVAISAANSYFSKANNASSLTPTSISLVATATGYTAPTYYWEYAVSTAPDTWTAAGSTSNTLAITNTTYASLIGSGAEIQYRLTISQSLWPTTISYYTINYSKTTNSSPVATLSRDSIVLPTSSSDVVTYTSSGTDIRVSINGVYIPVGTGANTFDVTTSSSNITVGTATTATTSVTNDTKRFGDLSAMSAGSTTVGTVTYTITARDVDGAATTFVKTQTITKAGVGATGTSGRTVALTTTAQSFSYTTAGDNPNPSSTTLTATAQNLSGTGYYEFLKWNGTTWVSMQASSTTNTYPYNPQAAYTSMPEQIRVDVRDGASTGTVVTSDTISMIGIKAGKDSITGFITNEAAAVATASDGTGADYTSAGGTFNVYDGTTSKTGNAAVTYSVPSSSGLTISIAATGVYTVTAMSADNATATLRAVYGGVTIDKIYSISRSKTGAAGVSSVTAAYTNDSLTVPLTSAGVATWTGSGGQFQVYDGNTLLTLSSTTQSTTTPATSAQYVLDITPVSGNTLTEPTLTGTTTVTISDWAGTLNTATVYRITAYIKTVAGNNVVLSRDVSISPSKAGADSTAYWMVSSVAAVQKSINNAYNPTSLTFTGYSVTGAGSPAVYAGRFKIYENGSATATYTSVADESSKGYTPSGSGVTSIKAEFYLSGGTATKLDEQTIPMVSDGNTGASAGSFYITTGAAVFRKDKANGIAPGNIALATAYTNFTGTPTYQWQLDGVNIAGATNSSYSVQNTDFTSTTTHTYKCTITGTLNGNSTSLSDQIVIPRLDDGTISPTVVASNSNVTFTSTASSGYTGITFTNGACNITAYLGSTQLAYAVSGASTFSASMGTPSGVTIATPVGSGSSYPVPAPSAMSADSAYVDITVTIRDAAGGSNVIVTRINYSLARTGAAGSSAGTFKITTGAAVFRKDKANGIAPGNIALATAYSNYTSPTYLWYKDGVSTGITTSTYSVPNTDYTSSTTHTYQCILTGTLNGVAGQTISDSTIIPRIDDGSVSPTVVGSNSNTTFTSTASSGYTGITFTAGVCNITAYLGSTQLTYATTGANTFSATNASTGVTVAAGSFSGSTYTVPAPTAMSADSAYTDVTVTIRDANGTALASTIVYRIVYSLARTGSAGTSGAMTYRMYASTTNSTTVPTVQATTTDGAPPTGTNTVVTWQATPVALTAGTSQAQWQTDGKIIAGQAGVANNTSWSTPYLSYFKVANLAAITANIGTLTIDTGGSIKSGKTTATDTTNAGIFLGMDATTGTIPKLFIGNAGDTKSLSWDGTNLTIKGDITGTSSIAITGSAQFGGYKSNAQIGNKTVAVAVNSLYSASHGIITNSQDSGGAALWAWQNHNLGVAGYFLNSGIDFTIPGSPVQNQTTECWFAGPLADITLKNGQLQFFSNLASTRADVLDCYLEGTWTPTITNFGSPTVTATFTKIGKVVTIQLTLQATGAGTAGTISRFTLPYAVSNYASFSVFVQGITGVSSSFGGFYQALCDGSNSVQVSYVPNGASGNTFAERLVNGSLMVFTGSYLASS